MLDLANFWYKCESMNHSDHETPSLTTFFFFFFIFFFGSHQFLLAVDGAYTVNQGTSTIITTSSAIDQTTISRQDFPRGFVFGAGSSAYQIEGAAAKDGRKPSIWDIFAHAGKAVDNGDVTADQYRHYKEDVKLMHETGLDAYRFSISWSRLIPDGHGAVNPKGLSYYNNLINALLSYGIEAHVTLSHFDIPQSLQDEYGAYLSPQFIEDFTTYANVCFKEFGDRVKYWMTFNEPNIQTVFGNDLGQLPPRRCSYPFGLDCSEGNSTTEPYIGAHFLLLSHAATVQLYRKKYQEWQRGQIGMTLSAFWSEPVTDSQQDIAATKRHRDFHLGWFLEPLVYGDYSATMRNIVGSRLPVFTENESKQLKGSFDFIGLNHYTVTYVKDQNRTSDEFGSDYLRDLSATVSFSKGLVAMDITRTRAGGVPDTSIGLQRLLDYVKLKYKNPPVLIHENGYSTTVDDSSNLAANNDTGRIDYLRRYIESLLISIRNGSNAKGYFVWSFIDGFEWNSGYTSHYGLYGVNFNDHNRKRYPRASAYWYSTFLTNDGKRIKSSIYLDT